MAFLMLRRLPVVLALLALTALLTGCTAVSARKVTPLDPFKRFFVEQRLNENHHLDEIIVNELRRAGREASSGPLTMMPENTDVVISYDARWTWDFKTYLIELTLELHTAHTHKKLADARYYQPSMRTKPPEDVVRELIARLLAK